VQMITMTVESTSIIPKLPKSGTACTEFSVGILQLIVMLWHNFIWLLLVQAKLVYGSETWGGSIQM
jgi:hypothetical protein